ncbi:H-NS histone family protein [Tabrizicola oligotrophica]|uniref:H-NS histone family protein n=1 Tax=Tabrizicola oligotrophica TaxID=2710650 RepID=UPI001D0F9ECB|nr:H-NS histone family protein [Tabrizicola oligotrophica]
MADLEEPKRKRAPSTKTYRHPGNPALIWTGRGRTPGWFAYALTRKQKMGQTAIPLIDYTERFCRNSLTQRTYCRCPERSCRVSITTVVSRLNFTYFNKIAFIFALLHL